MKMELPPEIVQHIRDFSRPLFPHYTLYNEMLRTLRLKRWPLFQERLSEEKTQLLAKAYLVAYHDRTTHEYIMDKHYRQEGPFVYEQFITRSKYLKQQLLRKQYREQQKFRDLSRHLYGEVREIVDLRREGSNAKNSNE